MKKLIFLLVLLFPISVSAGDYTNTIRLQLLIMSLNSQTIEEPKVIPKPDDLVLPLPPIEYMEKKTNIINRMNPLAAPCCEGGHCG